MHEVNCIGYAYFQTGVISEEAYRDPPSLNELRENFQVVSEIGAASTLAVIYTWNHGSPDVIHEATHMAVLDPDNPGFIYHRRGFRKPVTHEPIDEGLQEYLKTGLEHNLDPQVLLLAVIRPID